MDACVSLFLLFQRHQTPPEAELQEEACGRWEMTKHFPSASIKTTTLRQTSMTTISVFHTFLREDVPITTPVGVGVNPDQKRAPTQSMRLRALQTSSWISTSHRSALQVPKNTQEASVLSTRKMRRYTTATPALQRRVIVLPSSSRLTTHQRPRQ